jgi:hypothetical protein
VTSKPWWFNTVESRDLIGLTPEEQERQIAVIKDLNEWNARALKLVAEQKQAKEQS